MHRVVITGLGAITPLGNNVNDFWNNLIKGKSGAVPITKFDTTDFKTKFACEVKDFDILRYVEKSESRKLDLYTLYAIAATDECIKDAQMSKDNCDYNRVGVIWGTGMGGIHTIEEELISFNQNGMIPRFSPFFITKMIPNMASGAITIRNGFRGLSFATVSACTSSHNAIADALYLIRSGKAKIIIAGGSEAPISQASIGGFNASKALSMRNDSPTTASRPFDKTRDGFVIGEGAGALVIEDMDHAVKRGAKIYCEIVSCGFASDAYHITASHPEGEGAILAIEDALSEAGIKPDKVDYINAHATSTPIGDISECKAISKVFANSLSSLHISATKSMTGHLLGGAGAVEAISCILAIKNNIVPPTINLNEIDPLINENLMLTPNKSIEKEIKYAMNNTFGFGGHILVSLFKKVDHN
jgi:3-oxoacyl-[acyl-carrier-protein] synthase II